MGCSQTVLVQEVKPLVERFLAECSLRLSPEKTLIKHIEEVFDFLGQHVRKYNGKLLIKSSQKSVHAFLQKVRGAIQGQ